MAYRVETARSRVKKQLRRIPKSELSRIGAAVAALGDNPYPTGAMQLESDIFRIRVGNYRVIYKVYKASISDHLPHIDDTALDGRGRGHDRAHKKSA